MKLVLACLVVLAAVFLRRGASVTQCEQYITFSNGTRQELCALSCSLLGLSWGCDTSGGGRTCSCRCDHPAGLTQLTNTSCAQACATIWGATYVGYCPSDRPDRCGAVYCVCKGLLG
ncbi:hypothetical protein ONE63_000575 [Megalurothrips usitatus]|uniref:Uncharacterized protein n=1 Tax=Megalurothrips usitatus TaxID=439358 RepID=A0AAV7Y2V5_9NEOP|nr:hypothetical protein ONE63_000575 [Megalurothrips usitatus]